MNCTAMAEWISSVLPADREEPERARGFFGLVRLSDSCPEVRDIVVCLYRRAAEGTWGVHSLADLNMLIYALRENPGLISEVSADMERILAACGVRDGEAIGWNAVRRQAEVARAA